ncbi:MAG: acetyl-CoA decarbonylase/synthase complex subunit gamma [Candidatus Altiarchaeota archaeon]|nr:acetyl-CoA decarbonylase/synthase complex subunit gamma [Candidatus Altiarchaeota archaeon]MBU4436946.1 acetyl-CoA decarbonylase/synthase complex subunit gamma [Candidatus Altiarchaeota archaeon]
MKRLTALQVYGYLPKKNCAKCGEDTCMAFAIKLLEREKKPADCPEFGPGELEKLVEATTPPVRDVVMGGGKSALTLGGEEVMYRHELRFFNPTALMLDVSDLMDDKEIKSRVDLVNNFEFERIGEKLRLDGISIRAASGDAGKFKKAVEIVAREFKGPLVLCSFSPEVLQAGAEAVKGRRPLLYAANAKNWEKMLAIAKEFDCPLAVHSMDLSELGTIAGNISATGFKNLVLDPGIEPNGAGLARTLDNLTQLRKAALHRVEEIRYPLMGSTIPVWQSSKDETQAALYESNLVAMLLDRFLSLIVFHSTEAWSFLTSVVLKQNIYTDPRVEPSTEPKLYEINSPDENSPVFITSNFALTYFNVAGDLENMKFPCYLLVVDTEGLAVTVALAADKLNPSAIKKALKDNKVAEKVKHKKLILPGVLARISGAIEDATGWEVLIGPQDSSMIGSFLKDNWK